jgi:uncharacterized iron-regulated membrane protein
MNETFRQSMAWLHTWAGLLVGWVLFFIFLTGTAGYFDTEIDRWMQPERPLAATQITTAKAIAIGLRRLQDQAPDANRWFIAPPTGRDNPDLRIYWQERPNADGRRGAEKREVLDVVTGEPVTYRDTGGGQLLYKMHYELHYVPSTIAHWIVGIATMFMLVAIVTGLIIHGRIFRDFFTFRPRRGQRSWLDAHNLLGVLALPFHLMITYSGLIFFAYLYMAPIIAATYPEEGRRGFLAEASSGAERVEAANVAAPLASIEPLLAEAERRWGKDQTRDIDIRYPGDANARIILRRDQNALLRRGELLIFDGASGAVLDAVEAAPSTPRVVREALLGLHEGLFAGPLLRWLYFFSGLVSTAAIGAGLVLWTVKRRARLANGRSAPSLGLAVVERLNIGTIVGLPVAIAAYFWANRLMPAGFEGRAAWEAHAMFVAWAILLLHPVFRSEHRAWIEQLWLAAAAFAFLPVLNALTTDRHLGVTLPHGDWALAAFDLTMLASGLAFACVAWVVTCKAPIQAIG